MSNHTASSSLARLVREGMRYFVASGLALIVDVALFRATLALGQPYALAAVVGFVGGVATAYLVSIRWVFSERSSSSPAREFAVFVAIGILGLLLTEAVLWVTVEKLHVSPFDGKLVATGVVFACNFSLRRAMLFSSARAAVKVPAVPTAAAGDALA